ncbi:Flp pilus assembly protein TadB [Paenibacillus endophyticus]|uniref:Flp pilus assembly protein TadB n=1 Tax=Paenibacillus endophyticus TaxID=1294268 RepID=A0A7W5CBN8_9BACL|nr:Flp pilus assembly protein TadB [Paenibacillus endophyticus]
MMISSKNDPLWYLIVIRGVILIFIITLLVSPNLLIITPLLMVAFIAKGVRLWKDRRRFSMISLAFAALFLLIEILYLNLVH